MRSAARLGRAVQTPRKLNGAPAQAYQAVTLARPGVVGTLRTLEVGLHQCPSERNGQMSRCSASSSPSLVPLAVQTGAKAPGFSPTAPEFTAETDSPQEGDGFELTVPRRERNEPPSGSRHGGDKSPSPSGSLSSGYQWFESGPLHRRVLAKSRRAGLSAALARPKPRSIVAMQFSATWWTVRSTSSARRVSASVTMVSASSTGSRMRSKRSSYKSLSSPG